MSAAEPPAVADSVRLAWPSESAAIALIQRRGWAFLPAALGQPLLASVNLANMDEAWRSAIERPPRARCRVLVAIDNGQVAGFATTVPSADGDADPATDGEIDLLVIEPAARRRGHGSRLLNACADTLRADGFTRITSWAAADDDPLRRLLTGAGWAPDGAHREIGSEDGEIRIKQVRLHASLD